MIKIFNIYFVNFYLIKFLFIIFLKYIEHFIDTLQEIFIKAKIFYLFN